MQWRVRRNGRTVRAFEWRDAPMIDGAWLIRALASSRRKLHCAECGSRMFVKARSGRCSVCFTHAQHRHLEIDAIVT